MGNYIYEHSYKFDTENGEVTVIYEMGGQFYHGAGKTCGSGHDVYLNGNYECKIFVEANKRGGIGRRLSTIKKIVADELGFLCKEEIQKQAELKKEYDREREARRQKWLKSLNLT